MVGSSGSGPRHRAGKAAVGRVTAASPWKTYRLQVSGPEVRFSTTSEWRLVWPRNSMIAGMAISAPIPRHSAVTWAPQPMAVKSSPSSTRVETRTITFWLTANSA